MTSKTKTFGILLFIIVGQIAYGQTNKEKALSKRQEAIKLMDSGKLDESIKLLEEAQELDADRFDYPYELGFQISTGQNVAFFQAIEYFQEAYVYKTNQLHRHNLPAMAHHA